MYTTHHDDINVGTFLAKLSFLTVYKAPTSLVIMHISSENPFEDFRLVNLYWLGLVLSLSLSPYFYCGKVA